MTPADQFIQSIQSINLVNLENDGQLQDNGIPSKYIDIESMDAMDITTKDFELYVIHDSNVAKLNYISKGYLYQFIQVYGRNNPFTNNVVTENDY